MSTQESSGLVLIVEDNRNISEMVGEYLESRGFEVDYAADGLDGYRLATENSYDVIVLDLMLPRLDGIAAELAAALGDPLEVFDLDMKMHRAIVAAGHNAALSRSHEEYLARLWRIRYLSARRRSDAAQVLAAHRGMVDALAARDWPAMRAHMESHLDGLVRNLDAHFSDDDAEA